MAERHVFLRFLKMLGNCETPSKLSQRQKISMENVYWMVGDGIKISLKKMQKKEIEFDLLGFGDRSDWVLYGFWSA